MSRILIACGGTGGHLAPGIAVAEVLEARGYSCLLLISQKQVDSALVKKYGHLRFLRAPGRAYSGGLASRVAFFVSLVSSLSKARKLVRKESPDLVLLFGGFLSLGLGLAARLAGVPVVLHEANCVPGRAIRLMKFPATRVYLPEGVQLKGLSPRKVRYLGYPVRREIVHMPKKDARQQLGIEVSKKLLVVIGGSQGAQALNEWVIQYFDQLARLGISVYCVTGLANASDDARLEMPGSGEGTAVTMVPFSDQMGRVISAADLVISRAGAGSIAEIIRCRAPTILVPYPHAADDHQQANARALARSGAGIVLSQSKLDGLFNEVADLLFNDDLLERFKEKLADLDRFDSAELIADDLVNLAEDFRSSRRRNAQEVSA